MKYDNNSLASIFYKPVVVRVADKIHGMTGWVCTPPLAFVVVLAAIGFAVALIIGIAFWWMRRKPTPSNQPGATGRYAKLWQIKRYLLPGRLTIYIAIAVPIFIGSIFLLSILPMLLDRVPTLEVSMGTVALRLILASMIAVVLTESFGYVENQPGMRNHFLLGSYRWVVFSWCCVLPEKYRRMGVLVVGPTGSGKTSAFLINNVLHDAEGNCSVIIIDRKTDEDIVDIVGRKWNEEGKPVLNFDPHGHDFHFNPLEAIDPDFKKQATFDYITEIVGSIFLGHTARVGDISADADHHQGIEERVLRAVIMCVVTLPIEYKNLPTVLDIFKMGPDELNHVIALSDNEAVVDEFRFFANIPKQQQVNAMQGVVRKLQFLDSPAIRANLLRSDFDVDMVFQKPCLLIIKAALNKPDMGILASLMLRLIQVRHYAYADRCKKQKTKPRTIVYHLDEFPHLYVPNVHTFTTTIRSSGGSVVIYVHDLDDLRKYMEKFKSGSKEGLESSLRTWIVLPGCSAKTCQEIAESLGETVLDGSKGPQKTSQPGDFHSIAGKHNLVTRDALHFMDVKECLVLPPDGTRPFHCSMIPYFKDKTIATSINGSVIYYKPNKVTIIKQGNLSELLRQRASDIHNAAQSPENISSNKATGLEPPIPAPRCPKCGKGMVLRTARKGKKNGEKFWGCSDYPDCSGTLGVTD